MIPLPYKKIIVEVAKRIATITLDRPDVRNAFNPAMIKELTDAFTSLPKFKDVHAIVLRGSGKSFCAGADLEYMKSMAGFSFDENKNDAEKLDQMFWAMRSCSIPILGRLHGHVMGGALGLVALCDVAAAVSDTKFSFSEVRLGLAPAVISPYVLERMAPEYARRYMLTGEVFEGEAAYDAGLVQFVGDEVMTDRFISEITSAIDKNGPEAVRATKALLAQVNRGSWSKRRELTTQTIAELRVGEEGQEGIKSFLEKRDPTWRN